MRLLLFADLHLDAAFRWAGPHVAAERRRALRETLLRICRLADELRADALLSAGDLYEHERSGPATCQFLQSAFGALGRPVLLSPGNHDWYGPASLYSRARWPPNVHVFTDDRLTPYELADGFTVWGAAHRAPANTDGFLEGFAVEQAGVSVALFHGSERGDLRFEAPGKTPHAPFTAEQIPRAGLAHALVGHHHLPRDGDWHTYPGNPEPLVFGESGARSAVLLEVAASGRVTRTRQRVATTEVEDRLVDLTGMRHLAELPDRATAALTGATGVVRLTVSGEVHPDVELGPALTAELAALAAPDGLPARLPGLEAVLPRVGDLRPGYDLPALAAEPTVRGRFVRDVLAAGLDDRHCQGVLTAGLRALDGVPGSLAVE